MKRLSFLLLLVFPMTLYCSEETSHPTEGWMTPIWGIPMIFWQIANFALVIVLFYYLLKVKLPSFLRARKADIEKALNKAEEERITAQRKLKELEEKLSRLDGEIAEIIKEAERNAEKEKEILRKNAEESARWLKKEAEEEFKRREVEAERKVREYAVNQAIEIAKVIISKNFKPEDREKVFAEFIKDLKERVNG